MHRFMWRPLHVDHDHAVAAAAVETRGVRQYMSPVESALRSGAALNWHHIVHTCFDERSRQDVGERKHHQVAVSVSEKQIINGT